MISRDLVVVGPHALSLAHGQAEVAALIEAYAAVLPAMMARSMAEIFTRPRPEYDPYRSASEGRA
ncbi:MAG TPA: hypothetical protein VEA44_00265, partial [Caulobacter sp.]|nr:hypothetical protein [Caulobacter sp.]